jgi:peptide/nickel transport system ATP-binding protein
VPAGCPFHPRCAYEDISRPKSTEVRPDLLETTPGHLVACHLSPEKRREIFRTEISPKL